MSPRLVVGCALLLAGGLGCNAIVGIHDPVDKNPSGGGGTDAGQAAAVDRFVGTWKTTSGTQTVSGTGCSGAGTQSNLAVTFTVTRGTTSDIEATNNIAADCTLRANVDGDTATLLAGQTCQATFQNGEIDTFSYADTSTFALTSADGTQGIVRLTATITANVASGSCNFTERDPVIKQ